MAFSKQRFLSVEQETEAQALALRIRELAEEEFLQIARLLVGKPDREIFGETEFEIRDILLKAGAKALQERLRQKKTAITDAV
jgi:parvulin-like peptidyl-prolyl isomerase